MALRWCESFDGVESIEQLSSATEGEAKYLRSGTAASLGAGFTDRALHTTGWTGHRQWPSGSDPAELYVGMRLFIPDADVINIAGCLFGLAASDASFPSTADTEAHVRVLPDRRLSLHVGSPNQSTSPSAVFPFGEWFYVEFGFTAATGFTGTWTVRVNGLEVHTESGVRTVGGSGPASWGHFWLGRSVVNAWVAPGIQVDDVYIVDNIGSFANSFLGDQIVEIIRPNASGDLNEWVNSDGNSVNNWAYVNERDIDDARYNQSTVDGDRDLYGFQNLAADFGDLAGVQVTGRATHLGDPMNMSLLARQAGAESESSDHVLANAFRTPVSVFVVAPDAATWTRAKVNSAQFGTRAKAP